MLIWTAVAVAAGAALGHGRTGVALPAATVAIFAGAVALIVRTRMRAAMGAALVAIAAVTAATAGWRSADAHEALLPMLAGQKAVAEACGVVTDRGPHSAEVAVKRVRVIEKSWKVSEALRVSGEGATALRPGERFCAIGEVHASRPGRDDPPLLHADRIDRAGIASPLRFAAGAIRKAYSGAAKRALPPRQAGLLLGMTDGDTALLDPSTLDDFRATGLSHIVAVSGYNVAVFLTIVMLAARLLIRRGRWVRVAFTVPALVFFAFLTGLQPSVLRASVSAGVVLAIAADGRTADALNAAAAAFVVLLLISPDLLFHWGFQLSFGATLGILIWGAPAAERLAKLFPNPDSRIAKVVSAGFGTTLAAQLSVAPILAWHFGRVPGIGAAANLVAIPIGGLIMLGGLATLSAAAVVPFLGWTPATLRLPLDAILGAARVFARLPGATLAMTVLVGCAITAACAAAIARSRRARVALVALGVVCAAAGGGRGLARTNVTCRHDEVRALDVGQGTAVLLKAGGHAVLLDGGPPGAGIVDQLRAAGVRRVDLAIASHPHRDHVEGLVDVLGRLPVGRVLGPVVVGWGMGDKLLSAARRAHVPVQTAAAGDRFDAGPIHLDVLAPQPGPPPEVEEPNRVNGYSLLVRASIGGVSVVAPGDLEAADQEQLLTENLKAKILIAPHHGSANLDPEFVDAVKPALVLVTVGAQNPYGLPSPKALKVFSRYGPVMRTDTHGAITVCLDGGGAEVWTQESEKEMPTKRSRSSVPEVFG